MRKWLCWHTWCLVRTKKMRDVSFGEPGIQRTDLYEHCVGCGKARVRSIDGHWEKHELAHV